MTYILVDGSILDPVRLWLGNEDSFGKTLKNVLDKINPLNFSFKSIYQKSKKFLLAIMNCYQCAGFWSGVFIALLFKICGHGIIDTSWWFIGPELFICGCASSAISVHGSSLIGWLNK
jgi:hypothetical protein